MLHHAIARGIENQSAKATSHPEEAAHIVGRFAKCVMRMALGVNIVGSIFA